MSMLGGTGCGNVGVGGIGASAGAGIGIEFRVTPSGKRMPLFVVAFP